MTVWNERDLTRSLIYGSVPAVQRRFLVARLSTEMIVRCFHINITRRSRIGGPTIEIGVLTVEVETAVQSSTLQPPKQQINPESSPAHHPRLS
jgi:hypothetical protein